MTIHSFHLAEVPRRVGAKALVRPPSTATVPGFDHVECLSLMRLGAPVLSPDRLQLGRLAVFAQWRDEEALAGFLARDALGRALADGWHVRLEYLRRWSNIAALSELPLRAGGWEQDEPVVAVTIARMRLPEVPRFLAYGRPVERLVRDHPGVSLAVAGFRPPRTISTFSIWHSVRQMVEMVHDDPTCQIRPGIQRRCRSASVATSTTSSLPIASARCPSTASGRDVRASCPDAGEPVAEASKGTGPPTTVNGLERVCSRVAATQRRSPQASARPDLRTSPSSSCQALHPTAPRPAGGTKLGTTLLG